MKSGSSVRWNRGQSRTASVAMPVPAPVSRRPASAWRLYDAAPASGMTTRCGESAVSASASPKSVQLRKSSPDPCSSHRTGAASLGRPGSRTRTPTVRPSAGECTKNSRRRFVSLRLSRTWKLRAFFPVGSGPRNAVD